MRNKKTGARGFTLIASLLMLLLLSGIAIGLLMSVNTEQRAGGNDLQNTMAYRSAEGGIEKMTADLANLFANFQSPTASQIRALSSLVPTGDPTTSYVVYTLTPATNPDGSLKGGFGPIKTGPNQGLYAQTIPVTLSVTANRLLGQEVSMTRQSEMALIPIFQFGIFSQSDLSFFAGVNLDFQGRVHTNQDLYLLAGDGDTVTFHDKVSAFGNIVRTQLPNGVAGNVNHNGTVDVLTSSGGCSTPTTNCLPLATTQGSVTTGPTSGYNNGPPSWKTIAATYNSWLINGNYNTPGVYNAGAKQLQLSLVAGNPRAQQFEIIRRPPIGGDPSIDSSRLYTQAEIRILISDDPAELPGGTGDAQNIRLANIAQAGGGPDYTRGVQASTAGLPATRTTYFAEASTAIPDTTLWSNTVGTLRPDWPSGPSLTNILLQPVGAAPLLQSGTVPVTNVAPSINLLACNTTTGVCPASPYYVPPASKTAPASMNTWNLIDGYLRVDVVAPNGAVTPVTQEWLALGFARGATAPTAPGAVNPATPGANPINPKAILILQELALRNSNNLTGTPDLVGVAPSCTAHAPAPPNFTCKYGKPPELLTDANTGSPYYGDTSQADSISRYNWYPINFYDQREGEVRDGAAGASCTANGVMNAVELDLGNLKNWLETDPVGVTVDNVSNNGYILYFSDRRGMQKSESLVSGYPSGQKLGDSGLEDSINTGTAAGTPDRTLDTDYMPGRTQSPEDVNLNKFPDTVGAINLGNGFNVNTSAPRDPYSNRIANCTYTGRKNWVSGARHVLRLVDGSLGNVPLPGFTVGSENPVYIWGNYNTASNADAVPDSTWPPANSKTEPAHSAAGVIADAVTMLSKSWSDLVDTNNPTNAGARTAVQTYYRTAICAGKNINFPTASFAWFAGGDYGTDGGLHNFLRLLENWGGQSLNYKGSMVSLYYSTYATGADKNGPYSPPIRNYVFDPLFSNPAGLPPGTPVIRDVDNLSYRQDFTPRGGADQ